MSPLVTCAASSVWMCTDEAQDSSRNCSLLVKLHFGLILPTFPLSTAQTECKMSKLTAALVLALGP